MSESRRAPVERVCAFDDCPNLADPPDWMCGTHREEVERFERLRDAAEQLEVDRRRGK